MTRRDAARAEGSSRADAPSTCVRARRLGEDAEALLGGVPGRAEEVLLIPPGAEGAYEALK